MTRTQTQDESSIDAASLAAASPARRLLGSLRDTVRELLGGAAARATVPVEPPASPPRRVLLAEEDAAVRAALSAALSARGFEVVAADGGDAAVRCLAEDLAGFDLLVAGPAAARHDGDLLVRTVRRGGEAELAIVAVTLGADPGRELERAGADAVLDGSLGAELIARASEAVLARKRERRGG